jgi:ABC-type phosphate transport system substrate-binding protein
MNKLLFTLILLFPALAHAEWKSITCVSSINGLSQTIEFDEASNRVRIDGRNPVPALINKSSIYFEQAYEKTTYQSTISRSTGTLVIIDKKTSVIDSTYQCSVTKNKF